MSSHDHRLLPSASMERRLHPFHAFLLASAATLFVCALMSDGAYFMTPEIQWKNFATWLILGGLVFGGCAVLWALVDVIRLRREARRSVAVYFLILLVAWSLGIINELVHAKDAFASMPEGLILSAIVAACAAVATVLGFSRLRAGEV